MKVKIIKCSNKSFWYENEIGKIVDDCYLCGGWYITRDEVYSIRKQDAEAVEDVDKNCLTCGQPGDKDGYCSYDCNINHKYWKPIERSEEKIVNYDGYDKNGLEIAGVGQYAPTVTNEQGGKQSATTYAFDCLDPKAMFAMCKVLKEGRDKYGTDSNWRRIPVYDHLNHLLIHVFAFMAGDTSDNHLSHALCRAMFALAVADNE